MMHSSRTAFVAALLLLGCAKAPPRKSDSAAPTAASSTVAPSRPLPTSSAAASASARSPEPLASASATTSAQVPAEPPPGELDHVADCWANAMEGLGWLGRGTHVGQFMRTARDAKQLPKGCERFVDPEQAKGVPLSTGQLVVSAFEGERDDRGERVFVVRFSCRDASCVASVTREVGIPRGPWFCFNWVAGPRRSGEECHRSRAACNVGRAGHGRRATPCHAHVGAAYCRGPDSCYPHPWSCWNSGPNVDRATCQRTDR